jgi:hypothetical protein
MKATKSRSVPARPRHSAAVICVAILLGACHAAPVPEVAPSSPPIGPSDASEASSVTTPEALTPAPLETAPSSPEPEAPAESPSMAPPLVPAAPSVAPPAESPSVAPAVVPKAPSPPVTKSSPKPSEPAPAPAAAAPKSQGYTGDQPCQTKTFQVEAVEQACREGGRKAAKDLMKRAVANAKAQGVRLNCTSCHVDQKTYALQPDAVKELQRWL